MESLKHSNTLPRTKTVFAAIVVAGCILGLVYKEVLSGYSEGELLEMDQAGAVVGIASRASPVEEKKACTHDVLKEYYRTNHHFPGDGQWHTENNNSMFQPHLCRMRNHLDPNDLSTCLARKNVSSILILGDSNGAYYEQYFREDLEHLFHIKCEPKEMERRANGRQNPDKKFFTYNLNASVAERVVVNSYACGTCLGHHSACPLPGDVPRVLTVRNLPMAYMIDRSIQVLAPDNDTVLVNNSAEFYFKYHLKGRYPDLVIIFAPLHHVKVHSTQEFREHFKQLTRILKQYLPATTKVVFVPCHGEFESRRTESGQRFLNNLYEGFLANEKIRGLNQLIYSELESDLLSNNSQFYGFLDLWDVASGLESWSVDGVHFVKEWYTIIMRMFMEIFCNGD